MKNKTSILLLFLTFLFVNVGNADAQQKHEYVDLGLPSGTLWATCNVGANNPWDYGDYFAWGETTKKTTYTRDNYKYGKFDDDGFYRMTKYCRYGYNDYTDKLDILEKTDDVAYQKWGSDWCMPTQHQLDELFDNCTYEWTINYQGKGVAGLIFQSEWNDNTIFFPAAGYIDEDGLGDDGGGGYYWSSVLRSDIHEEEAFYVVFETRSSSGDIPYQDRDCGLTVRPVRCEKQHGMFDDLYEDDFYEYDGNATAQQEHKDDDYSSSGDFDFSFLDDDNEGGDATAQQEHKDDDSSSSGVFHFSFLDDDNEGGDAIAQPSDEYVDLGLHSGTLWATCNVGATNPWDYGDYFAWGETTTKSTYSESNYKYANGDFDKLTKYCNDISCCNNDMTNCRTTLEKKDDVAYQKLGSNWCMPTRAQFQELKHQCDWTWTTLNGINGYKVEGRNGNSIFLPAAGIKFDGERKAVDAGGYYWSSSVIDADEALVLLFYHADNKIPTLPNPNKWNSRYAGLSVRPVRSKK